MPGPWNISRNSLRSSRSILVRSDRLGNAAAWSGASDLRFGRNYAIPLPLLLPAFGGMGGGVNFAFDFTDADARRAFDNVDSNDGLSTQLTHRGDHPQLGNYARITANATAYATIRAHFDPTPSHVTAGLGVVYRLVTRINATTTQLSGGILALTSDDGSAELKFSTGATGRLDVDYHNGTDTGTQQQFAASALLTALTNGTTQDVVVRAYYTQAKDQLVWEVYADTYGTQFPGYTLIHRGAFTVTPAAITSGKEWSRDVIAAGFVGNANAISQDVMARDVAPAYDGSNKLRSSLLFSGVGLLADGAMNAGSSMGGAGTETNFAAGAMGGGSTMTGTYAITVNDAVGTMADFLSMMGVATQTIAAAGSMKTATTMVGDAQIANFAFGGFNAGVAGLGAGTQTIFAAGQMNAGMRTSDTHDVYIDANTGNDSNDGGSAAPWRSLSRIQYLSPGYNVWLARNSKFAETLIAPTSDIAVGVKPGAGTLPVVTAADDVTGWTLFTGNADRLIYTPWTLAAKANYDNAGARVVRLIIPAGLINTNGDKVAITLRAGTSNGVMTIDDMQIGQRAASGNDYDMTGTLTRITFNGGGTGCTVPQGTKLRSDIVSVIGGFDASKIWILSYRLGGNHSGWGSTSVTQVTTPNVTKTYYNPTAPLSAVTTLVLPGTGYANVVDIFAVEKFETFNIVSPANIYQANLIPTPTAVRNNGVMGAQGTMVGDLQTQNAWFYAAGILSIYSTTTPTNVKATVRDNAIIATNKDRFSVTDVIADGGTLDVVSLTGGNACAATRVTAQYGNARGFYNSSPNSQLIGCEAAYNVGVGAVGDALNVQMDVFAHHNGADGVVAESSTSGTFKASGKWRDNALTGCRVKAGNPIITLANFDAMNNGTQGVRIDSAASGYVARATSAGNMGEGILFTGTASGQIADVLTFANGLQDTTAITTYQVSNQGTGTVTADYSNFVPNARALNLFNVNNVTLGLHMNQGGPGPFTAQRREGVIMLTVDDWGSFAVVDAIAPYLAARGVYMTWGINTKAATSAAGGGGWAKIAGHLAAGHCIACHSRSHANLTDVNMFSIRYTGAGAVATVAISGNVLTTVVDGVTDHTINLATVTNDALQNVVTTINTWPNYTAVLLATTSLNTSPKNMADIAASDIKTATRTMLVDTTRYWNDEIVGAKADIEANLPGYTCDMFITPYTAYNTGVMNAIFAAGFKMSRNGNALTGGHAPKATVIDMMDIWGYDAPRDMPGQVSASNLQINTGALVEYIRMVGGFATLYAHDASTFSVANWQLMIDELLARNATIMHMKAAYTWVVANGATSDAGRTYTRTWPTVNTYDYTPRVGSPLIDGGVNIPGITSGWFGLAPDVGGYELVMNTGAGAWNTGASMAGVATIINRASGALATGGTLSDRSPDLIWDMLFMEPQLEYTIEPLGIIPANHFATPADTIYAGID